MPRLSSIYSVYLDDEYLATPMAPRGKRSDVTEKDLEEFTLSFSHLLGHLEKKE
jgi:hypothetical protein